MSTAWRPYTWHKLLTLLKLSEAEPGLGPRVFDALSEHQVGLTCPLEFPKSDPQHRQELKDGKGLVDGSPVVVDPHHIIQILLLAEELDIDEHLATSLFREVRSMCGNRETLLATCLMHYYRERANQLACLEYVVENACRTSAHPLQPLFHEFATHASRLDSGLARSALAQLSKFYHLATLTRPYCEGMRPVGNHDAVVRLRFAEAQTLGRIYYRLCECDALTLSDMSHLIRALAQAQKVNTVYVHLLVTLLRYLNKLTDKVALRLVDESACVQLRDDLTKSEWKVTPAQALAQLFMELLLYTYDARSAEFQRSALDLEASITSSLKKGALHFAITYLFTQQERTHAATQEIKGCERLAQLCGGAAPLTFASSKPSQATLLEGYLCEREFQPLVTNCLVEFITRFIAKLGHFLRGLHILEEDQLLHYPAQYEGQPPNATQPQYQRRHYEETMEFLPHEGLYILIALVFSRQHDTQLRFLDEQSPLLNFLRAATRSQSSRLFLAALDMIGGLASHSGYADWGFRAFTSVAGAHHPFSWAWLHGHLTALARSVRSASAAPYSIPDRDVLMLKGFLRLFASVFSNSKLAYASPDEAHGVSMLRPLFALLACPLDIHLKAALLRAIGAVAPPHPNPDLVLQIWAALDELGLLKPESSMTVELTKFEMELESNQLSLAFLGLMHRLLCPKPLGDGGLGPATEVTPRFPDVQPYLAFIVDELFVKAFTRAYRSFYQRWEVLDACLGVIHGCLVDFAALVDGKVDQLGAFSDSLLRLVDAGIQDLESYPQGLYPLRQRTTLRTLQILHSVATRQTATFLELGTPRQPYDRIPGVASVISLQKLLLHSGEGVLIQLASHVACKDPELSSLSVGLLASLCADTSQLGTSPLLQTLWSHPQSYLITEWFSNELMQSPYLGTQDARSPNPTAAILEAILCDIDARNTYSLSRLLLGYTAEPNNPQLLHPVHEFVTCFHAILGLLATVLTPEASVPSPQRAYASSVVAKGFQILARLCDNKATASATLLYLRSQHSFALRHLRRLPPVPSFQSHTGLAIKLERERRALPHDIIQHASICASVFKIAARELAETGGQGEDGRRLVKALLGLDLHPAVQPLGVTEFLFAAITPWYSPEHALSLASQRAMSQMGDGRRFKALVAGGQRWDLEGLGALFRHTEPHLSGAERDALLSWFRLENDLPAVVAAQGGMAKAWAELLKAAVDRASSAVDPITQESAILELMAGLLLYLQSRAWGPGHGLGVLGDVVHHLATRLHLDFRHRHAVAAEAPSDRAHLLVDKLTMAWDGLVQGLDISGGYEALRLSLYRSVEPYLDYLRSFGSPGAPTRLPSGIRLSPNGQELLVGNACYDLLGTSLELKLAALKLLAYLCPLLPLHPEAQEEAGTYLAKALPAQCSLGALVAELKGDVAGLSRVKGKVDPVHLMVVEQPLAFDLYRARVDLLVALARTPRGVARLLECNVFRVLIESGLLDAHLDASVLAQPDTPAREGSYQAIEPLLRLLSSILKNAAGSEAAAGKQASLALYTHSELLSSVLNFQGRRLTLRGLRLTEQAVAFIAQVMLSCRNLHWKEYGFASMYLIPILNAIAFLSDRARWAPQLIPYFAEEKAGNLVYPDVICPDVTAFQSEVDRVVEATLLDAAVYCRVVFCDGTPLVPLSSPLGFQPGFGACEPSAALISFTPKASIVSLVRILQHACRSLTKHCRNQAARRDLLLHPEALSLKQLNVLVPVATSESPLEARLHRMRSRAVAALSEQLRQHQLLMNNLLNLLKEALLVLYRQLDLIYDVDSPSSASPFRRAVGSRDAVLESEFAAFKSGLDAALRGVLLEVVGLGAATLGQLEAPATQYLQRLSKLTLELITPLAP
ncbi:hypothetical protein L0F63_006774 [Massospora cicadina]|nr:hypothetical protein L0F63_006774 [Massospora cicadina]